MSSYKRIARTLIGCVIFLGCLIILQQRSASAQAVTIPLSAQTPTVDGQCFSNLPPAGAWEYQDAYTATFVGLSGGTGNIYVKQTASTLYVCLATPLRSAVAAPSPDRFARVYLDTDNGREVEAESEDLGLQVTIVGGSNSSLRGDSAGGYAPDATVTGWSGASCEQGKACNFDMAEWAIDLKLLTQVCGKAFGMAALHHGAFVPTDLQGWPLAAAPGSPATWQEMTLAAPPCGADLSITKSDSADPVFVGQEFEYSLLVSNAGPDAATNSTVSDKLPAALTYLGHSAPAGVNCSEAANLVTCTIPSLAAGGAPVEIKIKVKASAVGAVSNTARVSTKTPPDPNTKNNQDTERTTVIELKGKIAYVFRSDTVTAAAFKALLESKGFTVQLVPLPTVLATNFAPFDGIMIADDTGSLDGWPNAAPGMTPEAVHIHDAARPLLGLGEGGYAYLGKHGSPLGWPNGWHGPLDNVKPETIGAAYWHFPTDFGAAPPDPLTLYNSASNRVGIHLPSVSGVEALGLEPPSSDHATLAAELENCNQLWGYSDGPQTMTDQGKQLFVNAVVYLLNRQCPKPPLTADQCIKVTKSATPADGASVAIGQTIVYRIKYTVLNDERCAALRAVLEDPVPDHTLFVPGSAGAGIAPGVDNVLRWNLGSLAPGATGNKSFKAAVTDAICNNGGKIINQARLVSSLGVAASNTVTHPVNCPPGVPAGTQPPYAEDEIQIYPYPMITGQPTELSVRIRNLSNISRTVRVTFEASPNAFGIGIPFGPLPVANNPRLVTLPPNSVNGGMVEVKLDWVPVVSGHYCIRVKIENISLPGEPAYEPVYTYRNLDVMEDLRPGVTDVLTFTVGNPTAAPANIQLVVANTCPGWAAVVNPAVLNNVAPGATQTATLSVTPPLVAQLGTACHIDVQGWIGDLLIGGIRKLDVPPVHLPPAEPFYMEKEIIVNPDPPVLNQSGQVCIELQNPMPTPRTVSVDFLWAAFGGGVPWTPISSLNNIVLPPNSFTQHCVPWTPTPVANGNLHRCLQVRLRQAGFIDQLSQRNVDLVQMTTGSFTDLSHLEIPFTIGNPEEFEQELQIDKILIGLNQALVNPKILPDPPPDLMPGELFQGRLIFEILGDVAAAEVDAANAVGIFDYGDTARVEVTIKLNDKPVSGFAVELVQPSIYLPIVTQ